MRGEAGIGKTRLVEEAQRTAEEHGLAPHLAWVLDFGGATGRDAIRSLLRSVLAVDSAADPAAAADRIMGEGVVADEDQVFLNDLLDLPQPPALRVVYQAMDNARRLRGKREVMARVVEWACRARPRLLVVEDVHWADRNTLAHLARLAVVARECPCLLLLTTRLDGDPIDAAWRAQAEGASLTTIDLEPLRLDEARSLAMSLWPPAMPSFRAASSAPPAIPCSSSNSSRLGQESGSAAAVPGTVQSLVQARLDRLQATDKAALQAAAVFGQRFERDALDHVLDRAGL